MKNELASWLGGYFESLHVTAAYNLGINAVTMVRNKAGAALSIDLGAVCEDLCFIPLPPVLETGSVLVWKKDQILLEAARRFIESVKNAFQSCPDRMSYIHLSFLLRNIYKILQEMYQ